MGRITGLGTAFISDSLITRVVKVLYRYALSSVSTVFFQNVDDKNLFISQRLVDSKVSHLTLGSGVDLGKFSPAIRPPDNQITFLLIGRMLWDKGVGEFVEAATVVRSKIKNAKFQLLGPLGVESRTAISNAQMADWVKEGVVEYLGETDCVGAYIEKASCVVLPSYREGTSRVCLKQLQWVVGLPLQPMLQGTGRLLTIEKTDFFVSQKAPLI